MNRFLPMIMVLVVGCCLLMAASPLCAQEWSKEQMEVWKNVQAYTDLSAKREVEGFMKYFHDDYCGWGYGDALPGNKADARKWVSFYFPKTEVLIYDIKPVAIKVHGNFAIVHYCYAQTSKDLEGKYKFSQGRWTDILMKQGDKWVMIGDHGGETSKE